MFSTIFSILDTHLTHVRGRDNLTEYAQSKTIVAGNTMTNYFCRTCGTLMYRIGGKGAKLLRLGTVDDFSLHEGGLRPESERYVKDRVAWLGAVGALEQFDGARVRGVKGYTPVIGTLDPVSLLSEQNAPNSEARKEDSSKGDGQSNYTQGYSESTLATHQLRTAESEAAFLLPYIKKTDRILDVGCGPGSITAGLAKLTTEGSTIGIDISTTVLEKARAHAAKSNISIKDPGSLVFEEGNILHHLSYPDDSFDIVFASQLFGHLPPPDMPLQALSEIRRVLKPGGILATRDGLEHHFYPRSLGLDELWGQNMLRGLHKGEPLANPTGTLLPALFRQAGFEDEKIRVGAGTKVWSGAVARQMLTDRAAGQLAVSDAFRQSWLDAGITEEEMGKTLQAVGVWAGTEGAWMASLQCEMLAWK